MTGPGQSLSVTLSRCSLRPSLAAIRAASCDLLALLPGLRIHATVIAHGISTVSLRQCFNILPRALSGSRAALCAPRCPHTPVARCTRTRCPCGARTQWALSAVHFAPAVPLHPALQGARTRALSSRPPRGFLGARARSFSWTQASLRADPPAHTRALCSCACSFCLSAIVSTVIRSYVTVTVTVRTPPR